MIINIFFFSCFRDFFHLEAELVSIGIEYRQNMNLEFVEKHYGQIVIVVVVRD